MLKENTCQPKNLYLANIFFKDESKIIISRLIKSERICHQETYTKRDTKWSFADKGKIISDTEKFRW